MINNLIIRQNQNILILTGNFIILATNRTKLEAFLSQGKEIEKAPLM